MRTKSRPITAHLHQIARPRVHLSWDELKTAVELGFGDVTASLDASREVPGACTLPLKPQRPHQQILGQSHGWVWSPVPGIWLMRFAPWRRP